MATNRAGPRPEPGPGLGSRFPLRNRRAMLATTADDREAFAHGSDLSHVSTIAGLLAEVGDGMVLALVDRIIIFPSGSFHASADRAFQQLFNRPGRKPDAQMG